MYLRFRTSTPSQREIFSQSCYCGLLVWSFLSGPAHPPKVKYSSLCYCSLFSLLVYSGLSGPAHPPKEKYSLKAVIVACSYGVSFQDQHTLPKRNILSHSCYCGLLSLLVYSGLSGPAHPPKEKYSLSQLLLWLALCICVSGPAHPPKEKYSLSQLLFTAVIVACSVYLRFRTSTPSQREIFSQSCYCGLLVWSCLSVPTHPPKVKYSTSTFT